MQVIKRIEALSRQLWLAGLGGVSLSRDFAVQQLDKLYEDTQGLTNELVDKGETLQKGDKQNLWLLEQAKQRIEQLQQLLNPSAETDKQLDKLDTKIDALTVVVEQLLAKKQAEQAAKKPATRKPAARKTSTKPTETKAADNKAAEAKAAPSASATKTSTRKPVAKKPASNTRKSTGTARKTGTSTSGTRKTTRKPAASKTTGD